MLVFAKFCSFAILAWNLLGFSTGSQDNNTSLCDLKEPREQCDQYCLMVLKPITNHIALHQNEWADRDATKLNETQLKLKKITDELKAIQQKFNILNGVLEKQNSTLISVDRKLLILMNFERIGTRSFYFSKNKESWVKASEKCKDMGGFLAVFLKEKDVISIKNFLNEDFKYWTGLNDLAKEGSLVSTASLRSASQLYTKWSIDTSNDETKNCVSLVNNEMYYNKCDEKFYYICQLELY